MIPSRDRRFVQPAPNGHNDVAGATSNGHSASAKAALAATPDQRAHRAAGHGDEAGTSQTQRESLGDWLDIDPNSLANVSPRSLAALVGAVEDGRTANTMVETQRVAMAHMQKAVETDPLTGIGNRRAIDNRLETEWRRARRHLRPFSVLMVDIDGLKEINDTKGHPCGDAVIAEVAHRIAAAIRMEDNVARIGGDEYMIVCPEADAKCAQAIVRKLNRAVSGEEFNMPECTTTVHVSIGWASTSASYASSEALVAAADARLYGAKRRRRSSDTQRRVSTIDSEGDHP